MADLTGVNYNEYEETSFEPIPAGSYLCAMTSSEMKTTKKGDGQFLKCEFQVLEGEFQNRKLWAYLNIVNPSEVAQNIGRSQMNAICKAVNVLAPSDSCELHDIPMLVVVGLEKDNKDEMRNVCKDFKPKTQVQQSAPSSNDCPI